MINLKPIILLRGILLLGMGYFAISLLLWLRIMGVAFSTSSGQWTQIDWGAVLPILVPLLLLSGFASVFGLTNRKPKTAMWLTGGLLLFSLCCFLYDIKNDRYQLQS